MAGGWIWYELLTTDIAAARDFYGAVVGWTIGESAMPDGGMDYRMIERDDGKFAGGVMEITDQMRSGGARPTWLGYIHVEDVDAAAAAIERDGGSIQMPPMSMEGVGRMAMVTDPQGAPFYLMTPQPMPGEDAESDVFSVDQPQRVRWNELSSTDPDAGTAFYRKHFGWSQEGEMDMGPMGKYRFLQHDGVGIGAIMPKMAGAPASQWTFYIGVDDIDRAVSAIGDGGGKVVDGPHQIPGGEYSVHAIDPQGAFVGLVGPRKE